MAYRFAATLGLAGLLAQSAVALPAPQAEFHTTVVVTVTEGAPAPPAATVTQVQQQQKFAPQQQQQQQQQQQSSAQVTQAPAPAPTAATNGAQSVKAAATSANKPAATATTNSGTSSGSTSSGAYGGGVCVDGNMGSAGTTLAQSVIAGAPGIKWYNNWGSEGSDIGGAKFFPMLHSVGQTWSPKGEVAIAYNEIDTTASATDPNLCSAFTNQYLAPAKAAGMKTTTPSFTSDDCTKSGDGKGTCWLEKFMAACPAAKTVDYINPHFYLGTDPTAFAAGQGGDWDYFQSYFQGLAKAYPNQKLLVTEIGLDPYKGSWTAAQTSAFLGKAGPWLNSQSYVAGWAAYQVGNGPGNMNTGAGATVAKTVFG